MIAWATQRVATSASLTRPAGMIGRAWNRLPAARVYADLSPGYEPTFLVPG